MLTNFEWDTDLLYTQVFGLCNGEVLHVKPLVGMLVELLA